MNSEANAVAERRRRMVAMPQRSELRWVYVVADTTLFLRAAILWRSYKLSIFKCVFLENHHVTQVNIFVKLEVSDVFENKTLLFLTRVSRRESSASTPVSWNCLSRLYNSLTENQKFEELCSNLSEFTKAGSTEQFVANRWAYTSKRSVLCEISSQLARVNAEIAVRSVRIGSELARANGKSAEHFVLCEIGSELARVNGKSARIFRSFRNRFGTRPYKRWKCWTLPSSFCAKSIRNPSKRWNGCFSSQLDRLNETISWCKFTTRPRNA